MQSNDLELAQEVYLNAAIILGALHARENNLTERKIINDLMAPLKTINPYLKDYERSSFSRIKWENHKEKFKELIDLIK